MSYCLFPISLRHPSYRFGVSVRVPLYATQGVVKVEGGLFEEEDFKRYVEGEVVGSEPSCEFAWGGWEDSDKKDLSYEKFEEAVAKIVYRLSQNSDAGRFINLG